jgi:4-amino-4-deoxy-L-arabinose transferase-like glycosyltransferase
MVRAPAATFAWVLAAGAVARWAAIATVGDVPALHGDEIYYVSAALSLAAGQGFPDSARPPGYPFLLSLAFRLGGESLLAARLLQAAVSLAGVLIVFDLARKAFGFRPAVFSALICALHPTLVHYSHFLWAETLYATLLLGAFWSLQRFEASGSRVWAAAAGAGLGLGALTREMALYFVPVVVLWIVLAPARRPGQWRAAGLLVLSCAGVVLPWTARNYARHHRIVPVATIRWLPTAMGNLLPERGWLYGPPSDPELVGRYLSMTNELEREALARGVAVQAIARQQPFWIVRKTVRNTYLLFRPVSQLSRYASEGWLRPGALAVARPLVRLEWFAYVTLTGLGIAGLWLVRHPRMKWLLGGYVVFSWSLYVLAAANHRYRVPLLPIFAVYTGPLLAAWTECRRDRWRRAGAAVCLAAFLAVIAADLVKPPRRRRPETAIQEEARDPTVYSGRV